MNKRKIRQNIAGYLFILPSMIGFLAFFVYPVFYSVFLSFMKWDLIRGFKASKFVGIDNYFKALKNEYFIAGLLNNLKILFIAVPLLLLLALLVACMLNSNIFLRGPLRTAYFMPYVTTITATAIVFSAMFHEELGPVNGLLRSIGIENVPKWLGSTKWAIPTIAIFWLWRNLGYCMIIYLSGLQSISKSYYEAASIDGATTFQKFRNITFPMVSPTSFFLAVTMAIFSFQIFAEVKVMTSGGPGNSSYTLVYHIYKSAFENYDMGYASSVALLFFGIIMFITLIQWLGQKKWVKY